MLSLKRVLKSYSETGSLNEQVNLYDKPEAAAAQRELTALMEAWLAQKPPQIEKPAPR